MRTASVGMVVVLLLAGCHGDAPPKETLLIAGNAAMARYLEPVIKEFIARNPSASVVCEPGGTSAAVIAVKRGAIDVAALSRQVSADEDDQYFRDYQVCRDGIAIIVNSANTAADITMKQAEDIFDGTVMNWKDIGGPDQPIAVYAREKGSRSARSFNEMILGGDEPFNGATFLAGTSAEMIAAVKKDPNAVGYVTMRHASKDVKVLKVESIEMNRLTMLSGRYPLSRTFYLAVYLKAPKLAEKFVEFAISKEGQAILAKDGLLPVH